MKRTKYLWLAALLLGVCLCAGCAGGGQPKTNGELRVVTSFYPMYLLTANVVGDLPGISVHNMAAPEVGCLHDYQLLPADLKALEKADVLVVNGGGMEQFLDKVRQQYPDLPVIEAVGDIALLDDDNPHVWVDPRNAAAEVRTIAKGLADLCDEDQERQQRLLGNGELYARRLDTLYQQMNAALAALPHRDIVTFHEAFPYFAAAFGLRVVGVIEREPGTEPSTRELAETVDLIRQAEVTALFAEPQYAAGAAEVIARETGAKVYTLDPVVTGPLALDAYEVAMAKNLATLLEALK